MTSFSLALEFSNSFYIHFLINLIVFLLFFSYLQNENIFDALRQFKWYNQSLLMKKKYLNMLTLNETGPKVKMSGLYELNRGRFALNMKTSYSLIGVLRLVYK